MGTCLGKFKGSPRGGSRLEGCANSSRKQPPEPETPQEEKVKEVLSISEKPKPQTLRPWEEEDLPRVEEESKGFVPNKVTNDRPFGMAHVCSEGSSFTKIVSGEERLTSKPPVNFQQNTYIPAGEIVQKERTMDTPLAAAGYRSGILLPSLARLEDGGGGGRMHLMGKASGEGNRENVTSKAARRDAGERSESKSVSPARNRTAVLQWRSMSASRANWRSAPRSVAGDRAAESRDAGFGSVTRMPQVRDVTEWGSRFRGEAGASAEGKESLENPFASLECFIFL